MQQISLPPSNWACHVPFARKLIAQLEPMLIVELGVYQGGSLFRMAQICQDLKLPTRFLGVDAWQGDHFIGWFGKSGEEIYRAVSHQAATIPSVAIYRGSFDKARLMFQLRGLIDILHIDGSHSYEQVKHDFENWLPYLRPGGQVWLHDALKLGKGPGGLDFGVKRFFHELADSGYQVALDPLDCGLGVVFIQH